MAGFLFGERQMNIEVPTYLQPLAENLSLVDIIRVINADRARLQAIRAEPSLSWTDIAGQDDDGNLVFWRDVPVDQRPADKQHLV